MRTILVVPYDPAWPVEFEKIKCELEAVLEGSFLSIEHVGSTSVPGLWAKPIIDIDIVIEKGSFPAVKEKLAAIGYEHVGDLDIPTREAFKYSGKEHLMEHHLYVCESDSPELHRHLVFRDHLRNHPEDRDRYSRIKEEMARLYPHDIDAYLAGKGPLILEIYRKCGLDE
jgi:GrpB-like predicted nucleotidyltransferase (UPF0157 family)